MPDSLAIPPAVIDIIPASGRRVPVVCASPHSGRDYPAAFVSGSALDATRLRRSEDSFVDELFGAAPSLGAPLIRALFPRAYVDPNREAWELDPAMFGEPLPDFCNTASPRVAAGLGTIPRLVATGAEIYRRKLSFAEAAERIERCHAPYHAGLTSLVTATREEFGYCILLDCHSMPGSGGPDRLLPGKGRIDFALGDCFGAACSPEIIATAETLLTGLGYAVRRNDPYSGGYTTRHYGRPSDGVHALQIEIGRALYMDEASIRPNAYFSTLARDLGRLVKALGKIVP